MACLSSTSHHMKIPKIISIDWIVSKDEAFFRRGIHMLPERWEKVMAAMVIILNKTLCTVLS